MLPRGSTTLWAAFWFSSAIWKQCRPGCPLLVHLMQSSGHSRLGNCLTSFPLVQQGSGVLRHDNSCSVAHPCAPETGTGLEKSAGSIQKTLLSSAAPQRVWLLLTLPFLAFPCLRSSERSSRRRSMQMESCVVRRYPLGCSYLLWLWSQEVAVHLNWTWSRRSWACCQKMLGLAVSLTRSRIAVLCVCPRSSPPMWIFLFNSVTALACTAHLTANILVISLSTRHNVTPVAVPFRVTGSCFPHSGYTSPSKLSDAVSWLLSWGFSALSNCQWG